MNYLLSMTEEEMREYIGELFDFQIKNLLRDLDVENYITNSKYMGREALTDLAVTLLHLKKDNKEGRIINGKSTNNVRIY